MFLRRIAAIAFWPARAAGDVFAAASRVAAAQLGARELALLAGLGLVGHGAGAVYAPAGFMIPGAVLLYVAIRGLA